MTHPAASKTRIHAVVAWLVLCSTSALAACGDDGDSASATAVSVGAKLDSKPTEASEALVMWNVSSGQPDYLYLWGRADVNGDAFKLVLRGRPPAEALNNYGLGVGMIVIAPRSLELHDGKQADADEDSWEQATGASERQAIIYVDHDQANARIDARSPPPTAEERKQALEHWLFDFPSGYSCGEGRAAEGDTVFDSYVPVDCSKVQVRLGDLDDFEFPNWT